MAIGKYLSLREAIRGGLLKRFANEHKTVGDKKRFESTLAAMTKKPLTNGQASDRKSGDED